jgi:hypothetical protein
MKSIAVSIVAVVVSVFAPIVTAQPHHGMRHFDHHHRPAPRGDWNWVAPAIIGGAVVYGLTRPAPVVIQQPVYIQQPVVVDQPVQVVIIDGVSYTKQVMIVNGVAQEVLVRQ